jgi:hypothetical protein
MTVSLFERDVREVEAGGGLTGQRQLALLKIYPRDGPRFDGFGQSHGN